MCNECDWEVFLEELDEVIEEEEYEWALDTLEGIRDWVSNSRHCTLSQREALENIIEAADR